jgi:site-specific recombinase XerD
MTTQPLAHHFQRYLDDQKLTAATRKNYVSDVQLFLNWLSGQIQENTIQPVHLTATVFQNYCRELNNPANSRRPATGRRHLSSLKRFGQWLKSSGRCESNPAAALPAEAINPTIEQWLNDFRHELKRQKLADSTIKNYLSDVNNYLLWAVKNIKLTDNKSIIL